jgi:hypothetical protein
MLRSDPGALRVPRRHPGRSARLFEAPLPNLTPRRVAPPANPLPPRRAAGPTLGLALEVEVASWSVVDSHDLLRALPEALSPLGQVLLGPRAALLRALGESPPVFIPEHRFRVSDTVGGLRIVALAPDRVTLAANWTRPETRLALQLGNTMTKRWLTVTFATRASGSADQPVAVVVAALGRLLLPEMVAGLARLIDTPKPEPPGRRFPVAR